MTTSVGGSFYDRRQGKADIGCLVPVFLSGGVAFQEMEWSCRMPPRSWEGGMPEVEAWRYLQMWHVAMSSTSVYGI